MKKILITAVSLLLFSSCLNEVLDKEPLDVISEDLVYKDLDLIEAYLAAQYSYTPVLVSDATTIFQNWGDNPINYSADWTFNMGNSEQGGGPFLSLDLTDEAFTFGVTGLWSNPGVRILGISKEGGYMEYWEVPYRVIRNLNEFIEKLPGSPIADNLKRLRIAEARFLRAFDYFSMVKRYGGVPLITTVQQMDDETGALFPERNTEKEIYDFIIKEMEEIVPDLEGATDYGRANQWAAKALACRAALYAGSIGQFGTVQLDGLLGIPANQAGNYYQKAFDLAQDIIDNGPFGLYDQDADKVENFKNIFLKKRHSEAIFAVQHDNINAIQNGGHSWSWDFHQAPKPHAENGGNRNMPYLDFVEEFEYIDGRSGKLDRDVIQQGLWSMDDLFGGKDPRFFATFYTNETPWQGSYIDFHKGLIDGNGNLLEDKYGQYEGIDVFGLQHLWYNFDTGFGVLKYMDESVSNTIWFSQSSSDYLTFRLAEILLNYAEAAFELNRPDDALTAVNRIRERAGIQPLSSVTREDIRHERKVELAFENHRYWDVRRWRTAEVELSTNPDGLRFILDYTTRKYQLKTFKIHGTVNVPNFKPENYYFPITPARINSNPNLVENPGY